MTADNAQSVAKAIKANLNGQLCINAQLQSVINQLSSAH